MAERSSSIEASFLSGGGEMEERIRAFDWSQTSLGPIETWPQSLKSAISICLVSRMPVVIWWDPEQAIQFYNDAYISFLGPVKHPAFLGRSGRECRQEIWETMSRLWDRVFGAGEATWSEDFLYVINRRLPQEEGYFTFSCSPIRGDEGIVQGIFCNCYETTGKVVGARRLETLRRLGEQSMKAASVTDACEKASAVLRDNPYDIPFFRIYHLQSNEGFPADAIAPQAMASLLQTRRPEEVSGLKISGGAWPEPTTQAIAFPLFSGAHDIAAGVIVLGVSPRRPLDDEYRGFFDLIAGHISTAMANALAREEEQKRAEALAEIDRAKTLFFSNVSHEFRTPLTLMLGPVEDLLANSHTGLSPAAKGRLEVVKRNGLRLLGLVNTLLDFSRIEAGRVQAVFEPTDLGAFTAELASVFRAVTERAGLRLSVHCAQLPEPVFVDRDMWEKIVLNLVSNAFKFTLEGEIDVSLQLIDGTAQLCVRDTGVGIPAEELPRIFERFHRVPNMRSRTHEGSGIGLSLVQELVKLHGGSVRVESRLNKGTTFTVTVPSGKAHLPAESIGATRNLASTSIGAAPFVEEALHLLPEPSAAGQTEKAFPDHEQLPVPSIPQAPDEKRPWILVADDNADMRRYLTRLLAERYNVRAAADGKAALDAARERRPDLILSDVMMPRLDGIGLLSEIRADESLKTIPLILLSARAGEESRIAGLQHGADDYLIKPFSARELLAHVAGHLDIVRIRKESEAALQKSAEHLHLALSASRAFAWEWDLREDIVSYSASAKMLFGRSDSRTATSCRQMVHPDDSDSLRKVVERAIAERSQYQIDFRVIRPDTGEIIWLHSRAKVQCDPSGEPLRVIGTDMDVSERKKTEEDLRSAKLQLENEKRHLEAVFQTIPVGIIITDEKGGVLLTNNRDGAIWGKRPPTGGVGDYVQYKAWWADTGEAVKPHEWASAQAVQEGRSVIGQVLKIQRFDGRFGYVHNSAVPIKDAQGHLIGSAVAIQDITELRDAQEALQKINATLEQRVAERTALAERRAKQMQMLAVELIETEERERRQFAHLLHEDLQQMLTAAKMQMHAITPTPSCETVLSNISSILQEAIEKSRRLSHELSPPILHQSGLIAALEWLSRQVREKFGLDIELEVNTELPPEHTPKKVFLFRAVQELLFNIVKHAGVKSAKVAVSGTADSVTVTVSDQGCGFNPEVLSTQGAEPGFGLLTITERAGYIGGAFIMECAPGQGSRFTLTIPSAVPNGHEKPDDRAGFRSNPSRINV